MATQFVLLNLQRIPVARVLIPFVAGIILGNLIHIPSSPVVCPVIILLAWFCMLLLFTLQKRPTLAQSSFFGGCTILLCAVLGMAKGDLSKPVDPELPQGEWVVIKGVVEARRINANSRLSYDVSLKVLYTPDTVYLGHTLLQVYLDPHTDSLLPKPGESWQWLGKLTRIRNSGNPGSPDYESVLQRKNCWYRFYPSTLELPQHSVRKSGASFRKNRASFWRDAIFQSWDSGQEELALLKAVCLGDRTSLTEDMKQSFGTAGGMHLLAVSGLHVGLVWWVLQLATGWMVRVAKTELFRSLLVLTVLWSYAAVTGFSSSVCRSVTMFSFFSAGRIFGQRTQMLNGIFVSALFLLVIKPSRLLELGFQLSYAAILGIIVFFPVFRSLLRNKNPIIRWLWNAASVSLSAQLMATPLVIYHFHQLPVYSVLTSILAVPVLSLLIALFTISVPFLALGIQEHVFHLFLGTLARLMNMTMDTVAGLPGALLQELHLSRPMLIFWMLFLGLFMVFLRCRSRFYAYLMVILLSVMILSGCYSLVKRRASSEVILCHFRGGSQVILREGTFLDVYSWSGDSVSLYYMHNYLSEAWSRRIYSVRYYEVVPGDPYWGSFSTCRELASGIWAVGNDHIKICVLRGPYTDPRLTQMLLKSDTSLYGRPDFILLSGEPLNLLSGSLTNHSSQELIMDGSNRSWFRGRMQTIWPGVYDTDSLGVYRRRW